ncbi:MAG TPA: hypothetical protein VJS42_15175 [Steroidobacteraceae bacterium]|nr:hypothetical protein [Steroidobacteraceae bacterium]
MPPAEIVAARLQQRRWLGTRPGKAVETLALEQRAGWSEPLTMVPASSRVTAGKWRSLSPADLYRPAGLDRLKASLVAHAEQSIFG